MEGKDLRILQRLGEDTAYTFKGLYKEADWLEHKYRFYLVIPVVSSIVSLVFDEQLPELFTRILAVFSLVLLFLALFEQKRLESVDSYRGLANEIKAIYDQAENAFHLNESLDCGHLREQWNVLRKQTQRYPIGPVGRYWSQKRISTEMNLSWLGGRHTEE